MKTDLVGRERSTNQHLIWSVGLSFAFFILLTLAVLSGPQSAGAIIDNIAPTPIPTSITNPGVNIKFQASTSPGVSGYLPDTGEAYGARGNGYTYGWNRSNTISTFDRNLNSNELYDTGIGIHNNPESTSGSAGKWEIELPSGWYQLNIGVGDPQFYNSVYSLQAEGVTIIHGTPDSTQLFLTNTPIVRVTDGRLTISSAVGASMNKLLFLKIIPLTTSLQLPVYYKARINFQPVTALPMQNYMVDSGQVYGNRGNGWTYGWNVDNTAWMVDRNSYLAADQRYDTFAYLRKDSVNRTWELAVPEGWYVVTLAGGEPASDSTNKGSIRAEGVQVIYQGSDDTRKWLEGHARVYVSDGKLTLSSSATSSHTKINFVEISQGEQRLPNLALGKRAKQSANHESYAAWRAVDGDTNGSLSGGSVAMTASATEAYWEVDLGAVYSIYDITLSPRNSHQERVDNYYILVSDNAFSSTSLSTARGQAGVSSYYQSEPLSVGSNFLIDRTARYIRVQLTGSNYLHLAEVEARGMLPPTVVWQAAASSSATGQTAFHGIDFNESTSWRSNELQTAGMYYKVDMRAAQSFSKLVLNSGISSRYPRAFEVYVTNDSSVYSSSTASWGSPIASGTGASNPVTITFPTQSARYLMVKLTASASDYWQIQELTVSP